MVVDDFCWLDQIAASDRRAVGEKAFYLGLLQQFAYPVLPGFVVKTSALEHFLAQVNWQVQMFADLPNAFFYVDANNPRQLQTVAQQIRQAMLASPVDELLLSSLETAVQGWETKTVILRPSFSLPSTIDPTLCAKTHSLFASQVCRCDRTSLAQGLKQVWSELFRAKSLFYWQRLGIQLQQVQLAVLVQPMRSVMAAGDLQILNQQVQIRAVHGLGYGLQQGNWDTYQLDLESYRQDQQLGRQLYCYRIEDETTDRSGLDASLPDIPDQVQLTLLEARSPNQPVLLPEHQQQLALLAQQTQIKLGMPLKLEWIRVDSGEAPPRFWLTQAVPLFATKNILLAGIAQQLQPKSALAATTDTIEPPAILRGLAAAPGRVIAPAWVIPQVLGPSDTAALPSHIILVTRSLLPHQVMQLRQIAGIITEQGGLTSHAAILARELGIPAVVGVPAATQRLQTGHEIGLDGDQGEVYCNRTMLPADWQSNSPPVPELPELPQTDQVSSHIHQTRLMIMLSQPDRLAQFAALPTDGVGLLRAEFLMLDLFQQQHPQDWLAQQSRSEAIEQIAARIQPFMIAFSPRPVFYRSLDLRSREFAFHEDLNMPHPTLGWRGTLNDRLHPALLQAQLAALRQIQQQGYPNLSLVLPFVRTVEEFAFCRSQAEQVGLLQTPQFQLWIMAEVPSVLWLLPEYVAAGVQGICIGVNDLTQLLLGIDRDHPQMAAAFELYHPVVLRAIQQLVQTAQDLGLACSFCGQSLDRHPHVLDLLLRLGIQTFVVEPQEVLSTHRLLADSDRPSVNPSMAGDDTSGS